MDIFVVLAVLTAASFAAWAYGVYFLPARDGGTNALADAAWVDPVGLLGLLLIGATMLVVLSGWRPGLW